MECKKPPGDMAQVAGPLQSHGCDRSVQKPRRAGRGGEVSPSPRPQQNREGAFCYLLRSVWKLYKQKMMQWKEIPSWEKPFTYRSRGSRCHGNLPGTKAGPPSLAASYRLLETSAQMCCNSSRTAPCRRQGQRLLGNVAASTREGQPRAADALRRMVIARLPGRCRKSTVLWSKTSPKQPPRNCRVCHGFGGTAVSCSSRSTSHSTGVWISPSARTQRNPALLPAPPLPGFPRTQKEINTFPTSQGLKINQRLSDVPGRALGSTSPDKGRRARLDSCRKGAEMLSKSN